MKWSRNKTKNYHLLQWVGDKGLISLLEETCGSGDAFLELGCGTGALIGRISMHYETSIGVDPSGELLKKAPSGPGILYIQKPLEEIDHEEAFDTVLMRNTLHHVADPELAISIAHRALKPEGTFLMRAI